MDNFKKELKEKFIPRIEILLKEERDHLELLLKSRKILKGRWFANTKNVDKFIINSQDEIDHIVMRLQQYMDFVNS